MAHNSWFTDRTAVLATMHRKERVIAPILEAALGIHLLVPENFNTDHFGTFTRDIERLGTQWEAARLKAKAALAVTGETLAIASEGAFFPHPGLPWLPCNREIVLLVDEQNTLEIVGEELSLETNYAHQAVTTLEEALEFARKVGFPEHGLVAMPSKDCRKQEQIVKGITNEENLLKIVNWLLKHSANQTIHLEADMRAMYNPTRLDVIAKATHQLVQAIARSCPHCSCPGFAVAEQLRGLPCESCRLPTPLIWAEIYQCQKCHFQQEIPFPEGVVWADPSRCLYCNP